MEDIMERAVGIKRQLKGMSRIMNEQRIAIITLTTIVCSHIG